MEGDALHRLQGLQHSIIDNIQQTEAVQALSAENSRRLSFFEGGSRRGESLQLTVDLHNQLLREEELREGLRLCELELVRLRREADLLRADAEASAATSSSLGGLRRASRRRIEAAWGGLRQLLEPIKEGFLMLSEERLSLLTINRHEAVPVSLDTVATAVERSEEVRYSRRRLQALRLNKNELIGEIDSME